MFPNTYTSGKVGETVNLLFLCSRTALAAVAGGTAGILGLTGLYGFIFYLIASLLMSVSRVQNAVHCYVVYPQLLSRSSCLKKRFQSFLSVVSDLFASMHFAFHYLSAQILLALKAGADVHKYFFRMQNIWLDGVFGGLFVSILLFPGCPAFLLVCVSFWFVALRVASRIVFDNMSLSLSGAPLLAVPREPWQVLSLKLEITDFIFMALFLWVITK